MTNLPPDVPPPPAPPTIELVYETPPPTGNAALLVRLAGIFLLISCGLDFLACAWEALSAALSMLQLSGFAGMRPPPMMAWMTVFNLVPPILSLIEASLKATAGLKLLRAGSHSWGWSLAAGIAGCLEIWSCPCCFISIATGIYTIVILCLPQVRFPRHPGSPLNRTRLPVTPDSDPFERRP